MRACCWGQHRLRIFWLGGRNPPGPRGKAEAASRCGLAAPHTSWEFSLKVDSMMSYRAPSGRRLRAEPLEDRRMMATLTVTTAFDVVNAGDGVTSLREAINSANSLPGEDLIDFDPA